MWRSTSLLGTAKQFSIDTAKQLTTPTALEQYRAAGASTGVPPGLIAALNYRESGGLFTRYLGNGDPLDRPTTNVPAGRGPFPTWLAGAVDALKNSERPAQGRWTIEFALYFAELFNGRGYFTRQENSPYVWSLTTQEQAGMFLADHAYDPNAWDRRPGVAALFLAFKTVAPGLCLPEATQQTEQTMTTQTPSTTPDPFPLIIEGLNLAKTFLPLLTPILGPAPEAIVQIAVPALEEVLTFFEQARTTGVGASDVGDLLQKIAADIHTIGAALKPKAA